MSKCDCYHVEAEVHRFVDEDGGSVYGNINVPRCWGTKEKDVCDCGGDKSKCNFYERVRAEAAEEKKLSENKDVLDEIVNLIGDYWGTNPYYYVNSNDKQEASAAKLCCKILETIWIAQTGEVDEEDS